MWSRGVLRRYTSVCLVACLVLLFLQTAQNPAAYGSTIDNSSEAETSAESSPSSGHHWLNSFFKLRASRHSFMALGHSSELLDLVDAKAYMVQLINQDRMSAGLSPVTLDDTASKAGQSHCDEMALAQYLSHWDLNGRKPDQRYSEAGGLGAVAENAAVTRYPIHGERYELAKDPTFSKTELEQIEQMFFNEQPPHDGHRVNILTAAHNKVGIGLSRIVPGGTVSCTQEFVNEYAAFAPLPSKQHVGQSLKLVGMLPKGVRVYSVDVRYEKPAEPMTVRQLWQTYSYSYPEQHVASYYPAPYQSPRPINVSSKPEGDKFELDIQPETLSKPGLYYLMVWVLQKALETPIMTLSRTVEVQ
jgi:uncharacterized protein YkwD